MKKARFQDLIGKKLVILDGATGTELALRGMPQGVCPELWTLEHPEAIIDIQSRYRDAGSDIVYTPTFGANRFKLAEFGLSDRVAEINRRLAELSRKAVATGYVFGDLAPTGRFIEPFGDVPFEEAVDIFKEQVSALLEGGVDGFIIETMMDIQEARAALLAVKESCVLPVMVSMTYNEDARTLNGTDPVSALVTLQSLGADAVGCNCSTGPENMTGIIRMMKPYAKIPLIAKPNAGMPRLKNGKTVFDMRPEEFASYTDMFIDAGVNILGGCCGTTPEHIARLASAARGKKGKPAEKISVSAVSSSRMTRFIGKNLPLTVIGERINPTGKKQMQEELREGGTKIVQQFAAEQADNGAGILDVNMGLSGIDEKQAMLRAVSLLSKAVSMPLSIDTTNPEIVEAALRIYPGRALINSISAEKERIEKTLPVAAKYGAMFILLPLTDEGIPATLEQRKKIVEEIIKIAGSHNFSRDDIIVDGLVMTISSSREAAVLTLDLIEWCTREIHVNTVCGLSNVSFGLPERHWINTAFMSLAISRGLSAVIANPSSEYLMNAVYASDALLGRDQRLRTYMGRFSGSKDREVKTAKAKETADIIFDCVLQGDDQNIERSILKAISEGRQPKELIDRYLIPAINLVGEKFDKKEYFLPQLIMSADAMRRGFEVLEPLLRADGDASVKKKATIVIATVKGDIHDIGKNIVALMLKNYNFEVIDLGKDVSGIDIVNAAKRHRADIIGLSALMTTTMVEMKEVISLAKKEGLYGVKFMIGGAVVDQNYSDEIEADAYAKDAMDAVKVADRLSAGKAVHEQGKRPLD